MDGLPYLLGLKAGERPCAYAAGSGVNGGASRLGVNGAEPLAGPQYYGAFTDPIPQGDVLNA